MIRPGALFKKVGMSSMFFDNERVPVTLLHMEDCVIIDSKNKEKDGYNAYVIGAGVAKDKKVKKPQKVAFAKKSIDAPKLVREFQVTDVDSSLIGSKINTSHFEVGQFVDATSISIGKGFAGSMKRHNFSGMRATHGVSVSHRAHGSTGQNQDPGKVFKGKKMAGRMGGKQVTVQNLVVVNVDAINNLIAVKGAVPGHKSSIVQLKDAVKMSSSLV